MTDIQAMMNAMSNMSRRTRSRYHLTLGRMIEELAKVAPSAPVKIDSGGAPGELMSYRGYYADLSFDPTNNPTTAVEVLAECRKAIGGTYEGYKGGDFIMGEDTPLWIASYGQCGSAVVGFRYDGANAILETKEVDP